MGQSRAKDICVYGGVCLPLLLADAMNRGYFDVLGLNFAPEQVRSVLGATCAASALVFLGVGIYEEVSDAIKDSGLTFPKLGEPYNNR